MKDASPASALLRAGRGRALPLLFLALAALTLFKIDATPLSSLRNAQFDLYQRQMPRQRDSEPVLVVAIDSKSLAKYGQWPWSRQLIARLVAGIQAGKPLAVGIDIVFTEADRYSPEALASQVPGLAGTALAGLPDPDQALARTLAAGPNVLAVMGQRNPVEGARRLARPLPVFTDDERLRNRLPAYAAALVSRPALEQAAANEGFINAGPEKLFANTEQGVLRRIPTVAMIAEQPLLSLPLEMVRLALDRDAIPRVELDSRGMSAIRLGDYRLPTQANGEVLLHFGKASSGYYLSAADVLSGKHPPETFAEHFVIIGFNSAGLQDRIITPLGESLPGVDVHVQMIESLLDSTALHRPGEMAMLEMGALLLGGLLLIGAVPRMRPAYAALSFAGLGAVLIGGGYLAFFTSKLLFDGSTLVLLLSPVFTILLSDSLIAADARRQSAERQLQASREEAARVNGELDAARRIQMGLLPDTASRFAGETRFAIAALLEPARAVGGDYYDCFLLDERHLCLVIGDVSGKGVPASLFMAISKTLTGSLTRRERDLGQAIRDLEIELSRENPEGLFVTAFVAVLDVISGHLEYICAGHDAPIILRREETLRIDTSAVGGPPLCAIGDYPFVSGHFELERDDLLCLFTDGVTEADSEHELFGIERLNNALRAAAGLPVEHLATHLRNTVRRFESGHPPSDDLTLLLLHWHG